MSDTATSLLRPDPWFTTEEGAMLAGVLAGYSGLTRDAYALDLRQFAQWCHDHQLHLLEVHRTDIDRFARHLEELGRARATIARRLCTDCCFYRYVVDEGVLEHSPATHVRRPRLDYESHAVGLDRNEVGAMLVTAGLSGPASTPWSRSWLSTDCGSPKPSAPTSSAWASSEPPHPHGAPKGRQDRDHAARSSHRPCRRPSGW